MSLLPWVCCLSLMYSDPAGSTRHYAGVLYDIDGDTETPVMDFNVVSLATTREDGTELDFVVVQDPAIALPWHARFGRQSHIGSGEITGRAAEFQVAYDNRNLIRELPPFILRRSDLAEGFEWTDGSAVYTVTGSSRLNGHECWVIEANNRIGYFRTLQIDKDSGALVTAHERVFFGQGDEFALEIRLSAEQETPLEEFERNAAVTERLLALQSAVGDAESSFPELEADADWEAAIGELQELSVDSDYANLIAGMTREYQQASRLAAGVSELADAVIGQPAPEFTLELLGGGTSTIEDRSNKVIVLHFWDYQNEHLEEPYGQVGYVDFLANRLKDEPVAFFGVAVHRGLGDAETRPAVLRSVRALKQFMNLGYPIGLDAGETLAAFGDPRSVDAALPLWIVISSNGDVVHYHAGHYDIDVNRGLEQLEGEIRSLLQGDP